MHKVELTPAQAPAISEAGMGTLDGSPGFADKCLLTVSKAKSCSESNIQIQMQSRDQIKSPKSSQ